jgi:hypothetical protein
VTTEHFQCGWEEEDDLNGKVYLVPYLPVTPTSVHCCQLQILHHSVDHEHTFRSLRHVSEARMRMVAASIGRGSALRFWIEPWKL